MIPNGFSYTVRRTNRRTMALEITPDGELLVRAPMHATTGQIRQFVRQNADWIETHIEKMKAKKAKIFKERWKTLRRPSHCHVGSSLHHGEEAIRQALPPHYNSSLCSGYHLLQAEESGHWESGMDRASKVVAS